jgi:hypothetical protein
VDVFEVLEQILKWLSDPKGQEVIKLIFYLIFPLIVFVVLRSATRRDSARNLTPEFEPESRPPIPETGLSTESLKETMAREQRKIEKELQETFGKSESLFDKARRTVSASIAGQPSSSSESADLAREESSGAGLFKLFSRRRG